MSIILQEQFVDAILFTEEGEVQVVKINPTDYPPSQKLRNKLQKDIDDEDEDGEDAADYYEHIQNAIQKSVFRQLTERRELPHYLLRNSLIPIATSFGNNISVILTGSFLIERIYNIDGFGLLGFESLVERDYPTVMGILVISSLLFLIGNILSDVCVAFVDPRVKFGQ
jgi:hypothetical protein